VRRMGLVASLALASLSLGSCAAAEPGSACARPEDGALICVYAGELAPEARLMTTDEERSGVLGSYCWQMGPGSVGCGDIGEIPALGPPVAIERGSAIGLSTDGDHMHVGIATLHDNARTGRTLEGVADLDLSDGARTIDVAPGRYVLDVSGRWGGGQDAELFFPIEIS